MVPRSRSHALQSPSGNHSLNSKQRFPCLKGVGERALNRFTNGTMFVLRLLGQFVYFKVG